MTLIKLWQLLGYSLLWCASERVELTSYPTSLNQSFNPFEARLKLLIQKGVTCFTKLDLKITTFNPQPIEKSPKNEFDTFLLLENEKK